MAPGAVANMVFHFLHRLPDFVILCIIVALGVSIALMAPVVGRRILRLPDNEERDQSSYEAFNAIMSMIGIILAFLLVEANQNLRNIENTVAKQASAISATDRILLRINEPGLSNLRPQLAAYGESVIRDEWPAMRLGDRSEKTDAAYNLLSKNIRAVGPRDAREEAMYNELLKEIDEIADVREQLIVDSELKLPDIFWTMIGCLFVAAFGIATFTNNIFSRRIGLAATAGAVALLLAFVIIVDVPFEGETGVSYRPIKSALLVDSQRR